jgi:hypothetical protein
LFAILPPAAAQEETRDKPSDIQIRGLAFSLYKGIDKLELRAEEKPVGELALSTGQLRNRTPVGARQFAYGLMEEGAFRSLGSVALPGPGRDFILVFEPTQDGYKARAVRTDDPEFRGDDAYLFNFTKYKLGILLGTAKQVVAPWESARLRPGVADGANHYQALFAYEENGVYHPFNNTHWPVNPNTKSLLFVFKDPATGSLTYRSCTDLAKP